MVKKFLLALLPAAMVTGEAFAYVNLESVGNTGPKKHNRLSFDLNVLRAGATYEFMFNPYLGIGANAYVNAWWLYLASADLDAGAFVRWYPIGGEFFLEGQAGYHISALGIYAGIPGLFGVGEVEAIADFAISPGLGRKTDKGKSGGFFRGCGVKVPMTFGKTTAASGGHLGTGTASGKGNTGLLGDGFSLGLVIYFQPGGAF